MRTSVGEIGWTRTFRCRGGELSFEPDGRTRRTTYVRFDTHSQGNETRTDAYIPDFCPSFTAGLILRWGLYGRSRAAHHPRVTRDAGRGRRSGYVGPPRRRRHGRARREPAHAGRWYRHDEKVDGRKDARCEMGRSGRGACFTRRCCVRNSVCPLRLSGQGSIARLHGEKSGESGGGASVQRRGRGCSVLGIETLSAMAPMHDPGVLHPHRSAFRARDQTHPRIRITQAWLSTWARWRG